MLTGALMVMINILHLSYSVAILFVEFTGLPVIKLRSDQDLSGPVRDGPRFSGVDQNTSDASSLRLFVHGDQTDHHCGPFQFQSDKPEGLPGRATSVHKHLIGDLPAERPAEPEPVHLREPFGELWIEPE